ncbi:ABC transporter permease [Actinoplanes sp. GCM10030250]|uniref:ABC transporter permease n=1 Tax=Actinoplanes sp. GCM10030250 TaxID=3273376 RepID=UPI00361E8E17
MLTLLGGRARAQWQLLASLLAVVTVGATLLGVCALLVTRTAEQALEVAASRAVPEDMEVTAYTVTMTAEDARSVADDTRTVLTETLAPFTAQTAGRASSMIRRLPGSANSVGYLSGVENLPERSELAAGRWPEAAGETVVLESTAQLLGLKPGSPVRLGPELTREPAGPIGLRVVGVVRPLAGTGWDRDPLGGAGYDLAYRDGSSVKPSRAYGPFLLRFDDLLASGSEISRLEITARPDLSAPDRADLNAVTRSVREADGHLTRILGERVQIERIASRWPATMAAARDQQDVTNGAVLAVAVLGLVLTGTALALAGRLTADVRASETALLSAMGTGTGRLALVATAEAGALAVLAAALAIPGSALLHAGLSRLQPMSGAGLTTDPGVTATQVVAVLAGAVVLAVLLVVRAIRPAPAAGERTRRDLLARSGTDLLLVALAVGGWWQLRSQPGGSAPQVDAVRVLAPALLLTAGAALALRLVPPALAAADRLARRAGGLSVPLAVAEAARRPQATAAGLLITLACAAGTFGVAFDATWSRSQHDQASLSVGTDLTIALASAPVAGQGAAVQAALGGTVSPATDRGMSVGQWLGGSGDPPRLVAVDADRAGELLRGSLDGGRGWAEVGAALAPAQKVQGVAVPSGAALTLTGTASGTAGLLVTPRLLLEDATGLRTTCPGTPIPLDGKAHRLTHCTAADGLKLVAVSLPITGDAIGWEAVGTSEVAVTLSVPGAGSAGTWTATSAQPMAEQLHDPAVSVTPGATATKVRMTTSVELGGPMEAARHLIATAWAAPEAVPVAVSQRFADEIGAGPGDRVDVAVDTTAVPLVVTAVVPAVPSAPGTVAALADLDTLSRVLAVRGELESPVDAWWAGHPSAQDAAAGLHLGPVTTRDAEIARLSSGPVPSVLPAVLRILVPAAFLLLLAGIILHVTCDLRARAVEVARLRGLGMTRREVRHTLLGQHAVVLLPMVLAGALVGAFGTRLIAPLLVRSATGAAPMPGVVPLWPWAAEALVVAVFLAACTLAVSLVVVIQSRRADAAHLRVAS